MPSSPQLRFLAILLLSGILVPAGLAAVPLWTVASSPGMELSMVEVSHDGSTIIAGGDKLIALEPDGTKLWSAWSGTALDLSRDGRYIVTSQGRTVRLFSRAGVMLWDQPMGDTVTVVSIAPDATLIAAGGGTTVQSWYNSGSGYGKNATMTVRDLRISPVRDQILVATSRELRSFNLSYVPNWYDDTISPGIIGISGDGTGIVIPNGNRIRMYHGGGTRLWDRAFDGGNIISLAYSDDGSTIVAGRDDGTVLVLDRHGDLLWTRNAGFWITSVDVSDNGSTIATGSLDRKIHIYDRQGTLLNKGETKAAIKSRSVAMSGDGSLIVAVDSGNVYCFSPSPQELPVAGSTPVNAANVTPATPSGTRAPVPSPPEAGAGLRSSTNATAPAHPLTPASGIPWFLAPAALVLIFAARVRIPARPPHASSVRRRRLI